ncbi:DUF1329 domain-containing protein [Myxococcota bacterium]|nr:DUF1329 domain-containing protein [Myxococcota bacterium]
MRTRNGLLRLLLLMLVPATARPQEASFEDLTVENWARQVGFSPDPWPDGIGPGQVLDASNRSLARAMIPAGLDQWIDRLGLALNLAPYRPMHPSEGYVRATREGASRVQVRQTGPKDYRTKAVQGYQAGLPFPAPRDGLQVAYNAAYAWQGDDARLWFEALWIRARSGIWRSEEWVWEAIHRVMHRTDLPPLPDLGVLARDDIQYASIAVARRPEDRRQVAALLTRYERPLDQVGFAFLPSMRRDLKMLSGTPGVTWNQSDMLWEDIRGYSGHPEWYDWTLVGRATILAPMHAGVPLGPKVRQVLQGEGPGPFNPRILWEPRPVYVLEGRPKMDTALSPHPYGRVVLYVDAESFLVPLKVAWDRKGRLWKVVLHAWNDSPDPRRVPPPLSLAIALDLRRDRATVFLPRLSESNVGLRVSDVTEARLRALSP